MNAASAKTAPKKLRLDFTPSEMGMLMGITLRIPEPELKAQWEAFLKRVVYIEAQPDAERTALKELYEARGLVKQCLDGTDSLGVIVLKLKTVKSRLDEIIDAQERAGAKAASERGGAT